MKISDLTLELPYVELVVQDEDLTTGGTTQAIAMPTLPVNSVPLFATCNVEEGWTVGGGDATALTAQVGDSGDPDEYLTALDLVGVATGETQLGGNGARVGTFALEAAAYAPEVLFTASGGASPLVTDADAGQLRVRLYYVSTSVGEEV